MMRAQSDPRRVYNRNDVVHVCYGGVYFSPGNGGTQINTDREVRIEVLDSAGGRKRIQVKQRVGQKTVTETWREAKVPVHHRAQ
jgi:hypothetical protein